MSRHVHLAAFFASLALAVPAALDADMHGDNPTTRPSAQQFQVGDATVELVVDHGVARPGEHLKVKLVATASTERDIEISVRTLETYGTGTERVQAPSTEVAHDVVTVHAAPGGGPPRELAVALPAKPPASALLWYDVEAGPADGPAQGSDAAARVSTLVWGGSRLAMKFEAPPVLPPDGPFVIGVRIKNTSKHSLTMFGDAAAHLGALRMRLPETASRDFKIEPVSDLAPIGSTLQPGAEAVFKFEITPLRDDTESFTILAYAGGTAELPEPAGARDNTGADPAIPDVYAALDTHTFTRVPRLHVDRPKPVVARQ